MADDNTRFLILGTAGHIDHGKTSLVRRLTGIDTDRLPEEKKRGITIDLGFANLDLPGVRFGIVDVPGHERFVHNMVAGATGVDLVMLVVAADDSVMPQTTEHLAILQLLGIQRGLVAVTKIDLVDRDHLDLVREELRDLLAGTFLAAAPIVSVSSATGEGLDALKEALARLAHAYVRPDRREVFRLPIDRVFSVQGHGTVVTGTVISGAARVGDSLVVMPAALPARVRRLQSHSNDLEQVQGGQRAAINIAGVKSDEIHRGDELAAEGYLQPAQRLLAQVEVLRTAPRPLENRQLLRLHLATREVTVRVIVKDAPIAPGEQGFIELRSRDWILADYGQRFILRQLSPVVTIGGGKVLDPVIAPTQRLRQLAVTAAKLAQADPLERLSAYLEEHDVEDLTPPALANRLGIDPAQREQLLERLTADRRLLRLGGAKGIVIHRVRRDKLGQLIVTRCERELRRRQPSRTLERPILVQSCRRFAPSAMLEAMIDDLFARGLLLRLNEKVGLPGRRASLTKNQQKWQSQLIDTCRQAGLTAPTLSEFAAANGQPLKEIETLARVAAEDDLLVRVSDALYLSPAVLDEARQKTVARLRNQGPATVADLRDLWGVTRKVAVPLCEFFDAGGITVRQGDTRLAGPKADEPIRGAAL